MIEMNMRKNVNILTLLLCLLATVSCSGQKTEGASKEIVLETTMGEIRIALYDDTPGHRDNIIANVKAGVYDGVLFNRVIRNFMIQAGDPDTRPGEVKDTTKAVERIPAEIVWPKHYHKRGMVGAARDGDEENPKRMSDKYQFYIVTGKTCLEEDIAGYEDARAQRDAEELFMKKQLANKDKLDEKRKARDKYGLSDMLEKLQDEARYEISENPPITYPQELRRAYKQSGGAPWLDNEYTVFGEVVEGMGVVEKIQKVKTDGADKPMREIRIVRAYVKE